MPQNSDKANAENAKVAGTGVKNLTPLPYEGVARQSSFNGVDGQTNNDKGNRNKS